MDIAYKERELRTEYRKSVSEDSDAAAWAAI